MDKDKDIDKIPAQITTVSAVVENDAGEILLLYEDIPGAPFIGWSFFGCEVGWGDDLLTPCVEYVKRLTGLDIQIKQLTGIYSNVGNYKGENLHPTNVNLVYAALAAGGGVIPAEGVKVKWVDKKKAVEEIALESIRMRVRDALEFSGAVHYAAFSNDPFTLHMKTILTDPTW